MICPSCANVVAQEGARFCPHCGVDFSSQNLFGESPPSGPSRCPKCNTELKPDYLVCPNCGEKLGGPATSEQTVQRQVLNEQVRTGPRPAAEGPTSGLSILETLKQKPVDEAIAGLVSSSTANQLGKYTLIGGWFVKRKLFGGYDTFKATDICWVCPKKTTQRVNFVATSAYWGIAVRLRNGKEVDPAGTESTGPKENLPPARADFIMKTLERIVPWAYFGYSEYLKECWEKYTALFLSVVDRRIDAIANGIRSGSLVVQADGTVVTTVPNFKLPSISMRYEGSSGKKMKRVYEVRG